MPILLTDTIAPNNTTFKAVLGKDVGGALTGSIVSSSGEILGATGSFTGTGSFGHVSSSGRIQAVLVDNAGGSLKQVIYDATSGELFTTTSTAAGVPSLEAVSQVSPFQIAANTVMTASNGAVSGIVVNNLYNGQGFGRIKFYTSSNGTISQSVFGVTDFGTADSVTVGTPFGLYISGGHNAFPFVESPTINAHTTNEKGLVISHFNTPILSASRELTGLSGPNYNLVISKGDIGTVSGFGNIRFNLGRTEGLDIRQLIVRNKGTTTDSTIQYDTAIKTRIGQTGGTGGDQFLDFSGSGVIIQPTSSLPAAVAGAMVYSGSQFYIAVP